MSKRDKAKPARLAAERIQGVRGSGPSRTADAHETLSTQNQPGVSSEPAKDAGTPELTLEPPRPKPKQTDFNPEMF